MWFTCQPVAQSIGIDLEAVNECIAVLSAMKPLDLEKFGAAQSGAVNRGLTRSDAGASCSISEDAEDVEAAKTKKAICGSFVSQLLNLLELT